MPPPGYREALARVYGLAPGGIRLGLDRVRAAAAALGDPQERIGTVVQVAGTNGKGSVACLVAAAARTAGLRVGLFTSPHLHRFTERFRLDGVEADPADLASPLERALALAAFHSLSFFEVATLAAFELFAAVRTDVTVLEVGLGGRLDATSIASPAVTAITSIGLDHAELLGDTLAAVAREKAAIARPGVPLVLGPLPAEARAEVERIAAAVGARIRETDLEAVAAIRCPWPGSHQRENLAVAHGVFEELRRIDARLAPEQFLRGVATARWPGRFEIVAIGSRRFVLDGAHNLEAARALARTLDERGERPDAMVFGALRGKPIAAMLEVLEPRARAVLLAPPPLERAFDPSEFAGRFGARAFPSVAAALDAATGPLTLVTGSLFSVAEARRILLDEPSDPPVGL
ncbi:MAG TPA: folylpolyglutamate synthase/dihydrofolate synthase family protein [Polyangia bacterium]|nr:folylpolyglutamate synthase/dihydrofolate synthase family protein [Polyangia bacterium]